MTETNSPKRIAVFFYGSFIRPEVMAKGGLAPDHVTVARLSGYEIHVSPYACIERSSEHTVYGIVVQTTHEELQRMYSMDGVGVFLPEAVVVETTDGLLQPAMCFMPPARDTKPADRDYLDRLIAAGERYGFPSWYLARLRALP